MFIKLLYIFKVLFIGYPIYIVSFIFKRNDYKWVFGSETGFEGNCKYFFLDISNKKINKIWIDINKSQIQKLKKLGFNAYYVYSVIGLYHLLTSGVYITSHPLGKSLPFWTIGNAKYINLWHGVGLKNMQFKANTKYHRLRFHHPILKYIFYFYFISLYKKPDLFLSTSSEMNDHFSQCFKLSSSQIVESNYPRCNLFSWSKDKIIKFIYEYEPISTINLVNYINKTIFSDVFIYMPTWRENDNGFLYEINFLSLNNVCIESNSLLLLKLHPRTPQSILAKIENLSNIIVVDKNIDIYPVLPFTTCLITDYSSIYYDYILLDDKSTIFYIPDYKEYLKGRDLAFDYFKFTSGSIARSFQQLEYIISQKNHKVLDNVKTNRIKKFFWGYNNSKDDIYIRIMKLIGDKNEKN